MARPPRLRVALLVADTPNPAVVASSGDYLTIFRTLLTAASTVPFPNEDGIPQGLEMQMSVDPYDVVNGVLPTAQELQMTDTIWITGSGEFINLDKAVMGGTRPLARED